MKNSWFSGLEPDAKKQMEDYFNSSPLLRERLAYIITNKIKSRNTKSMSLEEFDNPSWAYKQADKNGYERALLEIIELIS
jgi:hypothetical protein